MIPLLKQSLAAPRLSAFLTLLWALAAILISRLFQALVIYLNLISPMI